MGVTAVSLAQLWRAAFCAAGIVCAAQVFAGDFSASLVAASDYVEHGLTRSLGRPMLRAKAGWYSDRGASLGIAATTLNLNPGPGPTHEVAAYAGQSWRIRESWRLGAALAHYDFGREPNPAFSYDYTEFKLSAEWRNLVKIEAGYSPDYSLFSSRGVASDRRAISYLGSVSFPATRRLTLVGGLGHYDLRDLFSAGYWFWSGGIEFVSSETSIALTVIDSDATARRLFGDRYAGRRLVAAITWRPPQLGR
jgi:uncharacterized protein (TIGR02001 family)